MRTTGVLTAQVDDLVAKVYNTVLNLTIWRPKLTMYGKN